jgi:hypothetical protein
MVKPVPEYYDSPYQFVAWCNSHKEKGAYSRPENTYPYFADLPEEAMYEAFYECTDRTAKLRELRVKAGITSLEDFKKWMISDKPVEEVSLIGDILHYSPLKPTAQATLEVQYKKETQVETEDEYSEDDPYHSTRDHFFHEYEFISLFSNPTQEHNFSRSTTPCFFDLKNLGKNDLYLVTRFQDSTDVYDDQHNEAILEGVFDNLEYAQIYAQEAVFAKNGSDINGAKIYRLQWQTNPESDQDKVLDSNNNQIFTAHQTN